MSIGLAILLVGVFAGDTDFSAGVVRESAPGICPPRGSTIAQLDRIISSYLSENIDAVGNEKQLSIKALRQAWPCRRVT